MLQNLLLFKFLLLFLIAGPAQKPVVTNNPDLICGKWMAADKAMLVQIYRDGNTYKGKMLWFKNVDNSKRMEEWTDKHNPDEALRSRKLIGMQVLRDLQYNPKSNSWEKGKIYEAQSGKEWSASAVIDSKDVLKVTGYWQFKFIGKAMTLNRVE